MTAESFRLEIDRDRCQGHARCAALAPALFSVDDEGNGLVLVAGPISSELLDEAYLARSNCPELAIRITEEET
jgi:ferredoxin